jgi:hypothetical protein
MQQPILNFFEQIEEKIFEPFSALEYILKGKQRGKNH